MFSRIQQACYVAAAAAGSTCYAMAIVFAGYADIAIAVAALLYVLEGDDTQSLSAQIMVWISGYVYLHIAPAGLPK